MINLQFIILGIKKNSVLKPILILTFLAFSVLIPTSALAAPSIEIGSYEDTIGPLDSFFVFGKVSDVSIYKPVELKVIDPDGQLVYNPRVTIDGSGNFNKLLAPTLPSFKQGTYTVIASHEDITQTAQLTFTVIGGGLSEVPQVTPPPTGPEVIQTPSVERPSGFTISANAIEGSSLITVTGKTLSRSGDVTFTVTSPNGNLISVGQVSPSSTGEFSIEIITGGPLWEQDGIYTVTAHQGTSSELKDSVQVEIKGGSVIPEFGPIVMMVLFIAVSTVIVFSAKYSRLIGLNQSPS